MLKKDLTFGFRCVIIRGIYKLIRYLRKSILWLEDYVVPVLIVLCGIITTVVYPWYIGILVWTFILRIQTSKSPCPLRVFAHKLVEIEKILFNRIYRSK